MNCPHCGSKTPKEVKTDKINVTTEVIVIDGYSVSSIKPIFQCKNKSCKCAFNPLVVE